MSAVTIDEAWPGFGSAFTVAELDRMPDDGHRYETTGRGACGEPPADDGPSGGGRAAVYGVLSAVCPEDLLVVPEPASNLIRRPSFDPDLVVVPLDEVGDAKFTAPPLLVVEIRSPGTALFDLNRKKTEHEKFGVPSYWIVNPDPDAPSLPSSNSATAATSPRPPQLRR